MLQLFKREKCTGSRQKCQKPTDSNTVEIVLAVCIPVVVLGLIIAFVLFRVYRKGKREAAEDDDPDFNGDNTILPDFPEVGEKGYYAGADNPFDTNSALRYPAGAIESQELHAQMNNTKMYSHYNSSTLNAGRMDSFVLPYTQDVGSKRSLDNLAKALGSDYQGYKVASRSDFGSRASSFTSRPLTGYEKSVFSTENQSQTRLNNTTQITTDDSQVLETKTVGDFSDSDSDEKFEDTVEEHFERVARIPDVQLESEEPVQKEAAPVQPVQQAQREAVQQWNAALQKEATLVQKDAVQDEKDSEDVPDLSQVVEDDNVPLTAEEEEQIRRMKSVYKVYFSRENSIKSKKSVAEDEQFDNTNMPPLPQPAAAPQTAQSKPHLLINTDAANNDYRASYASSVYTENPTPYNQASHPQYPHQQIQSMLTAQEQERQRQYAEYQARQRYQQHPPQQQPQQPYVISAKKRGEQLPLPHHLENRKSSLQTFTEFQPNRKYSEKQHSSPFLNQKEIAAFNPIDNDYWSPTSPQNAAFPHSQSQSHLQQQNVAPHHFRNSVVMTNPVEITKPRAYRPAGSLTTIMDQTMSASNSVAGSPLVETHAGRFSPNMSQVGYAERFDDYQPPTAYTHGAQNLVTKSGSQQDLRKYIDNANI